MELKDIATVSGKGGLFKVIKPSRTGVVLESIDEEKKRFLVNANQRISILDEISIYTTDEEGSVPLQEVLTKIKEEFGEDPGVEANSDGEEFKAFLKHILPNYDEERVYVSDIKKLVKWYSIIRTNFPEVLETPSKEKAPEPKKAEGKEEKKEEIKDDEPEKAAKPAKKG
ncbi:MAG: DUF5606 domain-containing protein [Bacteroidota bacterium]